MNAPRRAVAADVPLLATLYRETVLALGPQAYTPEQVRVWSLAPDDRAAFTHFILDADTWIDEDGAGRPRAFCGIARHGLSGEVHSLYVHPDQTRRGLGSRLLRHALGDARSHGLAHCEAWATLFSRPVFERAGFVLARTVTEPYQGVPFERYRMVRMG